MLLQQIRKGAKSPALLWLGLTEQREWWSVKLDCFADLDYTRRNSASYNAEVLNRQLEAALQQEHGAELAAWQMELEGLTPDNAVCHYYRAARLAETGYTKEALAELSAGNALPECRFPLRYPISLLHEQIASGTQPRDKSLGALLAALEYSSEGRIGSLHEEWYSLLFTQLLAQQDVEGIGVLETALLRLARAEGVKQEHCGEILDFLSTSTGTLGATSAGASGGKGSTLQQHCNDINSLRVQLGFLYNQGLVNVPAGGQYQGLRALLLQPLIYEDYERLVREQYYSDAIKFRRAIQPGGSLNEKLKSLEGFDYSAWIKASPGGLVAARQ
ncbi:hypothetical protein IT575_01845 [bacterium]|nr:hypothetical protein [bacterium]